MSQDQDYHMSYEDQLQLVLSSEDLTLDDVVLSNGKIAITPRALLSSYVDDKDRDKILLSLSYNTLTGMSVKDCIIKFLKLAAQEGKLKL